MAQHGQQGPVVIDLFLDWQCLRTPADSTIYSYRRTLTILDRWLGEVELLHATRDHLVAWRTEVGRASSASTVCTYMSPVRSFYAWAYRHGMIDRDPACDVPLPRVRRRFPRPIGEDALEVAIAAASKRLRPMLVLAAYAGLRAREIAYLRRECVLDTARPPVIIVAELAAKGGHERIVPISAYVLAELRVHGLPRQGWVFPRCDGQPGPNTPHRISTLANNYLHAHGVTETLHQLRHRFGTASYGATRDLRVVQELLGHSSPKTTAGYAAFSSQRAVEAVNAVQPRHRLRSVPGEEYGPR